MVKYMVQRGDTLGTIAAKYGTTVQMIAQANGIQNPDMIYKGQILRIPTPYYHDNNNQNWNNHSNNNHNWHNYNNHDH